MIVNENYKIRDVDFVKTYSDLSVYIKRMKFGGNKEIYAEARYPLSCSSRYVFEETDQPIPFTPIVTTDQPIPFTPIVTDDVKVDYPLQ